jgi:hypothetical protein
VLGSQHRVHRVGDPGGLGTEERGVGRAGVGQHQCHWGTRSETQRVVQVGGPGHLREKLVVAPTWRVAPVRAVLTEHVQGGLVGVPSGGTGQ